ncbi:MAG: hypothetical protein ACFB9M_12555 [Myxococcota bacterium]
MTTVSWAESGDREESDERAGVNKSLHSSPHSEASTWLLGAKAVQLNVFPEEGDGASGGGAGLFVERSVVPGWLEVELSVSVVAIESETLLPVDVLFKKPFHFGPFCPYIALGPTVSIVFEDGTRAFAGGVAVAGFYLWLGDLWGFDVEVDYALLSEEGLQQELTFAAGPTLRF